MSVMNEGTPETLESLAKWMESCGKSAKSDSPANTKIIRQAYTRIAKALRRLDEIKSNAHISASDIEEVRKVARELTDGSRYGGGIIDSLIHLHETAAGKVW